MTFPEDCVQSAICTGDWWLPHTDGQLCRGALLTCFAPHTDQVPYTFEPIGRTVATEHQLADVKVAPLKVDQPLKQLNLPVAAMPLHHGEVWAAYRAKRRPVLVLSEQCPTVDKSLTRGMPNHSTAQMMLVAPYFGVDQNGQRAGFSQAFVDRVRHCEFPQFMWDMLPMASGPAESLLRLDQLQPMGCHHNAYKFCGYRLSDEALAVVDEMLGWLLKGGIAEDHDLLAFKDIFGAA